MKTMTSVRFAFAAKTLAILVSAFMILTLCACGGGSGTGEKLDGSEQSWGRYTLFVPDSSKLEGGNVLDSGDKTIVKLTDREDPFSYIMFNLYSLENCKNSIKGTKAVNAGAKDAELEAGGILWTGVEYSAAGMNGFQMYAEIDGEAVLATAYGYEFDGAFARAVLGSVRLNPENG